MIPPPSPPSLPLPESSVVSAEVEGRWRRLEGATVTAVVAFDVAAADGSVSTVLRRFAVCG